MNPLTQAGAISDPSKYATLSVNRIFTGLWTQRNPLREGAVPHLQEKFYAGSRFDSLIDGLNVEVTARLTLARRPGLAVFNSQTFPAILRYYEFRMFGTASENIRLMVDTAAAVYDATSTASEPNTKTLVFAKSGGAGASFFQSVGNALYFGNGVDIRKWVNGTALQKWGIAKPAQAPSLANAALPAAYPRWAAATYYASSVSLVDGANFVQKMTTAGVTGTSEPTWNNTPGGTTTDGTAVWTCMGTADWQANHAYSVGDLLFVEWLEQVWVLDGEFIGWRIDPNPTGHYEWETRSAMWVCVVAGNSGSGAPDWVSGVGMMATDGGATWQNAGVKASWSGIGASTTVSLATTITDANGNLEKIRGSGKSGATEPTWPAQKGTTTADGATSWINAGEYSKGGTAAWCYAFAYKSSLSGHVSTASDRSAAIVLAPNSYINVQGPGSADSQVDKIRIYRTAQGGSSLLLLAEIDAPADGAVWNYQDTSRDDGLNFLIQAAIDSANDPPPAGLVNLTYYLGRIWGSVGNTLSYSAGPDTLEGSGNESFPPNNYFVFPRRVIRLWPTTIGLLVFTTSDVYIVLGKGTGNDPFYTPGKYLENTSLLSYDAFCANGATGYLLTAARKLLALDPGAGVVEVGFPIGDILEAGYVAESAFVTWHEQSSSDTALYVGDGATGWYRMAPTSAPESGVMWSPRAIATGGTRAVQSVEVEPGKRRLLVSPGGTGGPILMRSAATHADNGAAYVAWAEIGSIVMAQSGQIAELEHICLDSLRVGSRPKLGVLLGEISGPFEEVRWTRQDPPLLPPSDTLYSDRYVLSQNQQATLCRHFQWRLDWAAENAANELLAYSVFGATHNERRN